jgi:hypothetical protein
MTETYTLSLSLLDFIPNLAFLTGAYYLIKIVQLKNRSFFFYAAIVGSLLVFLGGTLKAIWKLLVTVGVGDFHLLSNAQFPLHAPGFFLLFICMIFLLRQEKKNTQIKLMSIAVWKIPLLAVLTISSLGMNGILAYLSFKRKANFSGILFLFAFLSLFTMAGMAGGEQGIIKQWIEEIINLMGQTAFAVGSFLLLKKYQEISSTVSLDVN